MSQCKGCGREIVWAKGPNGKLLPLEKATAYELDGRNAIRIDSFHGPFISHYLTCPKANEFSGKSRKREANRQQSFGF